MSYSTVYGLWPGTTKRVELAVYRNSHGMAPVVWSAMAQKYFGKSFFAVMEELWKLHERRDIPRWHRTVMRMTFDTYYIADADRAIAIDDIAFWQYEFAHCDRRTRSLRLESGGEYLRR